ncbi:2-acylglycerol O-acyltransferase [Aureococcus anophagefferens]|nr:2-acylglycerol O-acyltransferase [Aureococcus anophagefferens]
MAAAVAPLSTTIAAAEADADDTREAISGGYDWPSEMRRLLDVKKEMLGEEEDAPAFDEEDKTRLRKKIQEAEDYKAVFTVPDGHFVKIQLAAAARSGEFTALLSFSGMPEPPVGETLHATAALPPGGKCVLGYHPHGVVSLGAFVGVGTNGVGLDDAFPGLDFHLCTLAVNFKMPFIRELILRLGIIPASKACIRRALARNGGAVCIAVGGAKEALLSTPGAPYELYLGKRKGFVREALLAEASLVPTFAFGELDVFRAPARGSRARRWLLTFQNWGLGWYGYSLPVFCGNLPFTNVGFGLQPISEAVHIVTGAPIPHDGVAGPVTDARVDAMHARTPELRDAVRRALALPGDAVFSRSRRCSSAREEAVAVLEERDDGVRVPEVRDGVVG